jgi:hypothetical protein
MKKRSQNQTDQIAAYLERGKTLTSLSALRLFDCFRLSARIHDIRRERGLKIEAKPLRLTSGKTVAQYSLVS